MKIIGLTGGIGSGKTTVAYKFKEHNIPIYIADERSKFLLANHPEVIQKVKMLLGSDAYNLIDDTEVPNRAYIASKVFTDKTLLADLNNILHPAVRKDFKEFCKNVNVDAPYIIYEAAILFESSGDKHCDYTIVVTASQEERITRVMERDQISREDVLARMKNQWSDKEKVKRADFVIVNDYKDDLQSMVDNIHGFLLKN